MNLAAETVVGLPGTNLVQPSSSLPPAARDPFLTDAESVDVEMESQPSASELLARAAALGPARMTWESIVLAADPVLDEKRQPHVAERRERLTRIVKLTLGACVGVCVLALGISAVSGDASASTHAGDAATLGKTVASKGVVPVEPLDGTKHGKAARHGAPSVTTAAIVRPKHR